MKRFMTLGLAALMSLSAVTMSAQNKFKGIVKYEISSVGTTPVELQPEQRIVEVRVMESSLRVGDNNLQVGRNIYSFIDLSMMLAALQQQYDIEFESYQGDGKIFLKNTLTQEEIDSLTIPVTEGFYVEYVEETKQVAGVDCKKAVLHSFDEDGKEEALEVWYAPEIGPEVCTLPVGVMTKGLPMEMVMAGEEGRALKYQAVEVTKGKVKDVEFLMRSGYKELPAEQWKALQAEIQEAFDLINGD